MSKSYLPTNDSGLLGWAEVFVENLKTNADVLNLDSGEISELEVLTEKFESCLIKLRKPNHIPPDRDLKNEAAKNLRKSIMNYATEKLIDNPLMTSELQYMMRIPRKAAPKKAEIPTSSPRIVVIPGIGKIIVRYYNDAGKRARPARTRGIVYYHDILDHEPKSASELGNRISQSSGPLIITCTGEQRGMAFYVAAYWENSVGDAGPWSDIVKVYIP